MNANARSILLSVLFGLLLGCTALLLQPKTVLAKDAESFAIGDVEVISGSLGTTWIWPVEIDAEGSFIVSVDNLSCQGLTETYEGNFRVDVEGPTTFNFTNYVKSGFVTGNYDPNSSITIMRDGIVVFHKTISAPICEAPKPSIEVFSTEPYTRGNMLWVQVLMPENASLLHITTDFAFFPESERLPKGCRFGHDYRNILCEQSVGGNFLLDLIEGMNPGQGTFVVRAYAQFTDYDVTYGNGHPESLNEVVLPLAAVSAATCELEAVKVNPVTYRLDYSWEHGSPKADYHSLYSGQSVFLPSYHNDIEGVSGSGSFTFTYPLNIGEIFTPTLFIVGDVSATCEDTIVIEQDMPDPTCEIEAIEGDNFHSRVFKVSWRNGYQAGMGSIVLRYLSFGDGRLYALVTIDGDVDYGRIRNDYDWDKETGFAEYTASLTIETPGGSYTCTEYIEILDPDKAPGVPTPDPVDPMVKTYLVKLER